MSIDAKIPSLSKEEYAASLEATVKASDTVDFSDAWGAYAQQAFHSNMTMFIADAVEANLGMYSQKKMTGEQANIEFGLADTPAAFKPDEEVSQSKARVAAEQYHSNAYYDQIHEQFKNQAGTAEWLFAAISGTLFGGLADPIGLGIGVGTAKLIGKGAQAGIAGMTSRGWGGNSAKFLDDIFNGTTKTAFLQKNAIENTLESMVTESAMYSFSDDIYNTEQSLAQSTLNMFAGAILGTGVGTVMEVAAHKASASIAKKYGVDGPEIARDVQANAMGAVKLGTDPNPDVVFVSRDMERFLDRPGQTPHTYRPIDEFSDLLDPDQFRFYGMEIDNQLVPDGYRGNGTIVLNDSYNYSHNTIARLDGSRAGHVHGFELSRKMNILTNWQELKIKKAEFFTAMKNVLAAHTDKKFRRAKLREQWRKVKTAATKSMRDSQSYDEFLDNLYDRMETLKEIPDMLDMTNLALRDLGYDGYHYVRAGMDGTPHHNALVLLDPNSYKNAKNPAFFVNRDSGKEYMRHNFDVIRKVLSSSEAMFDPEDTINKTYLDSYARHFMKEADRLRSAQPNVEDAISHQSPPGEPARNVEAEFEESVGKDQAQKFEEEYEYSSLSPEDKKALLKGELAKWEQLIEDPDLVVKMGKGVIANCLGG